jgi:hypothetical protein
VKRRKAKTKPSTSDAEVLEQIDAAVQQLCACGCGRKLVPAAASMWFYTEACQQRFQARGTVALPRQTDEAAARQTGTDGIDIDRFCADLDDWFDRMHLPAVWRVDEPPEPLPYSTPDSHWYAEQGWRSAAGGPVSWVRRCEACRSDVRPIEGNMAPPITFMLETIDPLDLLAPMEIRRCDMCPDCHTPWLGPKMLAQWRGPSTTFAAYELRLIAANVGLTLCVSAEMAHYPDARIYAWTQLERGVVDALTFRERCQARGCDEIARVRFETSYVLVRELKVCPRHAHQVMCSRALELRMPQGAPR